MARFDHLAALTIEADQRFAELRALYQADAGLRVPPQVFNAVRKQMENVGAAWSSTAPHVFSDAQLAL
ncbi:hypothetical protein [Rhizobium croatiense]|uniref:hypothetical protein n=1 Tax=Rhizobium croatiense TaxID=2867516 RepID=UPI001FEB6219|nr:hypothetical protein [Rhizobium croatiense]